MIYNFVTGPFGEFKLLGCPHEREVSCYLPWGSFNIKWTRTLLRKVVFIADLDSFSYRQNSKLSFYWRTLVKLDPHSKSIYTKCDYYCRGHLKWANQITFWYEQWIVPKFWGLTVVCRLLAALVEIRCSCPAIWLTNFV